ncbi:MAG: M60 family metallopeptidase, partial [Ruminiclostridium sp.]|nr:M60 family metallopeptidase [Ruminiclostridium sp.]
TQKDIEALRERLNTPDEISGELNPDLDIWERELKNAEDVLNNKDLRPTLEIHTGISTYDTGRGFGGINAWQPIGITADAGSSITVYVGHNSKRSGENTNLQLVATQYHSESSPMFKVVATLKTGVNVIDIPKLWTIDAESGGALYIQYTGNNPNERYAVRVSGGNAIPVLDLYKVTDEEERASRTETFISELTAYVNNMEKLHNEVHANSDNKNVNKYEYNDHNCVLGAADIMLDTMMFSLPAKRIVAGAGSGTVQQKAERMLRSFEAMEDMMYLFYQHKGLNANAEKDIDRIPKGHQNIRYQRMFAGAFMYASGNHIGIEWNECAGMVNCGSVVSDKDGRYVSGNYFGWGIAHEIGHCINQGSYAVAEITNNYFAQLAQAKDSNSGMRFTYKNIYDKVTSGTIGSCSNIATQLGMYWQLHLAYDNCYNYKTFEDPAEQLGNLFYARVDTYSRTPALAPAPNGIALTLSGGTDQALMRLACAAAEKNVLEFFKRWGKVPDSGTIEYAEQFEEETRAIYYVDDNSKVYRIENPDGGVLGTEADVRAVGDDTTAKLAAPNSNQVNFTFTSQNIPEEDILGYEIVRCTTSGGVVTKEAVGFSTASTYTDYVATLSNRVVTYEVTLIDKYLNRSEVKVLEPIKICTDGSVDKTNWTLSYSDIKALNPSASVVGDDNSPCEPVVEDAIYEISDGNDSTVYTASIGENAEITVEFNKKLTISGFKYKAGDENPIGEYIIMVKDDTGAWTEAAKGTFGGDKSVYFSNEEGKYVSTYKTDAVKLVIPNQTGNTFSIAEIDVLGVTGDNVDFRGTSDGVPAVGILSESYQYAEGDEYVIPEGSVVFIGAYKGNPAYNVVLLYDDKGSIVGGFDADGNLRAQQIILADVPETGNIQDVYAGTWIYC